MAIGRRAFNTYGKLLRVLAFCVKIFPKFLRIFMWDCVSRYSQIPFIGLRYVLAKSLAKSCGDNIRFGKNVTIIAWEKLKLGNNISIHDNCYVDANGGIIIEHDVSIAHNSTILSTNHSWADINSPIKYNEVTYASVKISADVWIGCGCRILAGVTISSRSIVAAGAVVNNDVRSGTIVGGVPAKIIKEI